MADIFTKALPPTKVKHFAADLGFGTMREVKGRVGVME